MERWNILGPGSICWNVASDPQPEHEDHIEMAGQKCAVVIRYGVDDARRLRLRQTVVLPTLRTIPNNTHASLLWERAWEDMAFLEIDGQLLPPEQLDEVRFDGILRLQGRWDGLSVIRTLLPSREGSYMVEHLQICNSGSHPHVLSWREKPPEYQKGCHGVYILAQKISGEQGVLGPGETRCITAYYVGETANQPVSLLCGEEEIQRRQAFVAHIAGNLVLETPDPALNNAFALAKLRAAESVYRTRGGLFHGPGGLDYYAAVWTNDQIEYPGPLFPYLGEENTLEASKNALRAYIPFMAGNYAPIPSSIIAEGLDIWDGAGDRGDAAMYACGASQFLLALGDRAYAERMLPAVEWCLEYCRRKTTERGVVVSDSDELENRFSSGDANLSTSCLVYGGLLNAARLEREFGRDAMAEEYTRRAVLLAEAIESYFGANVEGYDTYRYHDGCERLWAWICLPLVFGIKARLDETVKALFSERLWTADGLATESGGTVFWDRSTLYALRGVFAVGETEKAIAHLTAYSRRRTLGEHVPYPVEAWPEGGQRHLSAESALYCRIFTEGILGMEPLGFRSFRLTPSLPWRWEKMTARRIHGYGTIFDLSVVRDGEVYHISVDEGDRKQEYCIPCGGSVEVCCRGC